MKIKIMMVSGQVCDVCNESDSPLLFPVTGDWDEIPDEEYDDYRQAVMRANYKLKHWEDKYILVRYDDSLAKSVFASAQEFLDDIKKREEAEEKRKKKAAEKKAATALARKRKQLEKLQKELGEET